MTVSFFSFNFMGIYLDQREKHRKRKSYFLLELETRKEIPFIYFIFGTYAIISVNYIRLYVYMSGFMKTRLKDCLHTKRAFFPRQKLSLKGTI